MTNDHRPTTNDHRIEVPATTSNLGPGFDVLGLALTLTNTVTVRPAATWQVTVAGEGAARLPQTPKNLVARAFRWTFERMGERPPVGVHIHCQNRIPVGSGLGSSAAAVLAGMAAALAWMGRLTPGPVPEPWRARLLAWALEWEGHPDNAAPALYGGLVAAGVGEDGAPWVQPLPLHPRWEQAALVLVLPQVHLPTKKARAVLPRQVPLQDAVFNLAHALLVVEALRTGDAALLGRAMQDRWHQPYRLPLIPGAEAAMHAAREAGAVAVMLSGAGPSLLAWCPDAPEPVARAMQAAFARHQVASRVWVLHPRGQGLQVLPQKDAGAGA